MLPFIFLLVTLRKVVQRVCKQMSLKICGSREKVVQTIRPADMAISS